MDLLAAIEERLRQVIREEIARAFADNGNHRDHLLLNTRQAADLLCLPASWVASAARRGGIPSVKLGHHIRFKVSDLETFIDEQCERVEMPALQRRTETASNSERQSRRLAGSDNVRPVRRDELP